MMAGMSADSVMLRNNFNLYYIFLSKGLYEDAYLILKSFVILNNDEESLEELTKIETGSDNILRLGIFELSKFAYDIVMGNMLLFPSRTGFKIIDNDLLKKIVRDYKCRMNIIMNQTAQKFASAGIQLPIAPSFDIPSDVFGGQMKQSLEVSDIGTGPVIKPG